MGARAPDPVEHGRAGREARGLELAREFIFSVPKELTPQEQFALATVGAERTRIRRDGGGSLTPSRQERAQSPRPYVLCTLRKLEGDHFCAKKAREWNGIPWLKDKRESWCAAVNGALEQAGRTERVDHRSLKDRGIDRDPQPKDGKEAMALKRKGLVQDPERCQAVRLVKMMNELRPMQRAIKKFGAVAQKGVGKTWWERTMVFGARAKEAVKNQWQKMIDSHRGKGKDMTWTFTNYLDLSRACSNAGSRHPGTRLLTPRRGP